mmetsp:Transcript_16032/g.43586  ORF Transcript_16032/g.43586 Transcript_16032/m.43586 type:complete len:291 (-) Transcript_16032:464-1336(-)
MGCGGSKADDTGGGASAAAATPTGGEPAKPAAEPPKAEPPPPPPPQKEEKATEPGGVVLKVHTVPPWERPGADNPKPSENSMSNAIEAEREASVLASFAAAREGRVSEDEKPPLPPLADLPEDLQPVVETLETRSVLMDAPLKDALVLIASHYGALSETAGSTLDVRMAAKAQDLGKALLLTLGKVEHYRAFGMMPAMMEKARGMIEKAPARGITNLIENTLSKGVDACEDAVTLQCTLDVLELMVGKGPLREKLGKGFDAKFSLPETHISAYEKGISKVQERLVAVKGG